MADSMVHLKIIKYMSEKLHNDAFEKDWQQAFENVHMTPPEHIWVGIEQQMPKASNSTKSPTKLLSYTAVLILAGLLYYFYPTSNQIQKNENYANIAIESQPIAAATRAKSNTTPPVKPSNSFFAPDKKIAKLQPDTMLNNIIVLQEDSLLLPHIPQKLEFDVQLLTPEGFDIRAFPISEKTIHAPIQYMDSNQYYDPSRLHTLPPTKGGILKDIRLRGGVRISN
jgi:hypothetical protein